MKKNLKSSISQVFYDEPDCILDMNQYSLIEQWGLTPDLTHKKNAHLTAAWQFGKATHVRIPLSVNDLSGYRYLTFSVFAVNGQGGSFNLRLESDKEEGGEAGYSVTLPLCRNGWNDYRIELPFLHMRRQAQGFDRISAIVLDCAIGGQGNSTDTGLYFDNFYVYEEKAPELYVRMPELKGAAMFSKTASFAIVDRKRLPIAVDGNELAKPFDANGLLWLPMAPIAAAIAHKAAADNKANTLTFSYRRKRYQFTGNTDRYSVDGTEEILPFKVAVRAGTLFFPAGYVKEFFHWRQIFTDPNGLVILSNRRNIFEIGRDDFILWRLNAALTFAQPTGEEILYDLHKKIPNTSKGRLLLLPEEWMVQRRLAKTDSNFQSMLAILKEHYGSGSAQYQALPVFSGKQEQMPSPKEGIASAAERITSFAALYRLTGEKKYALRTFTECEALAALPDWCADESMLLASTAGLAMAFGYDWCHSVWSEAEKAVLERSMLRYALRPGVECYNGKRWMWQSGSSQGAQINCGLIALALALSNVYPETSLRILNHGLRSLSDCLEAYAPDGGYSENILGWEKATNALVLTMAMLESAVGKDYGLSEAPGFAATPFFAVSAETENGAWNFHACSDKAVNTSVFGWFAKKFNIPALAWLRQRDVLSGRKALDILDLIWYSPIDQSQAPTLPLDALYRKAGAVTFRSGWEKTDCFFAIHGGSNHEIGGELDAGSFVLEMGGERFICETGGCEALPILLRARAEGQNTLVVNPTKEPLPDQNPDAVATITEARSDEGSAYAILDMTSTNDAILKGKRGILLTGNRTVAVVQDELTLSEASHLVWSAYTHAVVKHMSSRTLVLGQNGKTLVCKLSGVGSAKFAVTPLEDFLRITVSADAESKFRMAVSFKLLGDSDSHSEKIYDFRPMSAWGNK